MDQILQVVPALLLCGFFAVIVFWGRRTCKRCHKIFHTLFFWRAHGLCMKCETETGVSSWEGRAQAILALLLLVALVAPLLVRPGPAFVVLVLAAVPLAFVLILLRKESRRAWLAFGRSWFRELACVDFRAARRASGKAGGVLRFRGFTVWTDVTDDLVPMVEATSARTIEEFARLTGLPAKTMRPVRILYFQDEAAFLRYTQGISPEPGRFRGFYSGLFRRRVVFCRETASMLPATLEETLSHELTHHLTRCNLRARPLWLQEGLAVIVASRVGEKTPEAGAARRWLKAALARGGILAGKDLFSVNYRWLHKEMKNWRNLESAAYGATVYVQSAAFLESLSQRDEGAFRKFLAGAARTRKWGCLFRSTYGVSPDEALGRWIEDVRSAPLPPRQPLAAGLEQRVQKEIVSVVRNRQAPRDDRLLAIRGLSGGGYVAGVEALVEVLENPGDDLRPEAQRALENIAGGLHGTDAPAWRHWWESLPGENES